MGPRPEVGYAEATPGVARSLDEALSKVGPVCRTQFAKLWFDSLGVCFFSVEGIKNSMELTRRCLAQAVGWEDFTMEEAFEVGERVTNLMRLVYGRRGFKKSDELDVSPKHLQTTAIGTGSDKGIAPYLPAMVDEYYRQMGWSVETGVPTPETLRKLDMGEFSEVVR